MPYAGIVKTKKIKSIKVTRFSYQDGVAEKTGTVIASSNYDREGFLSDSTFFMDGTGQNLTLKYKYDEKNKAAAYVISVGMVSIEVACDSAGNPLSMLAKDYDDKPLSMEKIIYEPGGAVRVEDAIYDSTDTSRTFQVFDAHGNINEMWSEKGKSSDKKRTDILKDEVRYLPDGRIDEELIHLPGNVVYKTSYEYDVQHLCTAQITDSKEGVVKTEFIYNAKGLMTQAYTTFTAATPTIDVESVTTAPNEQDEPVLMKYEYEYYE
jgi:hypothetical protein